MIEAICKSLVPVWTLMLNGMSDEELDAELATDVDRYTYDFLCNHLQDMNFYEMMKHQLQLRYLESCQQNSPEKGIPITVSENGVLHTKTAFDSYDNPISQLYALTMAELDLDPIKLTNMSDLNIFATINTETDELLNMIRSDYPSLCPE